jgi:hypothetical protein
MSDSSEKRTCAECGEEREVTDFALNGKQTRRGERYRARRCNSCMREYFRRMRQLRKTVGARSLNCELCRRIGQVVLDHDHTTGDFRGWLCVTCNCGLGKLGDDITSIRRAIGYLDRSSNPEGEVAHSTSSDSDSPENSCRRCGEHREATEFPVTAIGVRGREGRARTCRICINKSKKQVYQLHKTIGQPAPNCELCRRNGQMVLDHDHTTGDFRGWLCGECNRGLGQLADSIQGLRRAIAYLERSSASSSGSRPEERERSRTPRRHGDPGGEGETAAGSSA